MNLRHIEFIITVIAQCIAYFIAETGCGYFRAWCAAKMGDDTAKQAGFQSLNPLVHVDIVGFMFLLMFGFGWGRYIAVNPYRIYPPWRYLKVGLAFFSDSIAHIVIALVGLLGLVRVFGVTILNMARPMIVHRQCALKSLAQHYPDSSSLVLAWGIVLLNLIFLCILLAVLHFLINSVRLGLFVGNVESETMSIYIEFLVPVILIMCCADGLSNFVINSILMVAHTIAPYISGIPS